MNKFFKIIRIITVVPFMAFSMLTILYLSDPTLLGGLQYYFMSVLFLTILPLLAYPLQPYIATYKNEGREGQRNLAIIMAVLGYTLSLITAVSFGIPKILWIIYLVYCITGILMLLVNKGLKIRASGHAAGVIAPIAILIYINGVKYIYSVLVLILVYWASIRMKRHTPFELLFGSILPLVALALSAI